MKQKNVIPLLTFDDSSHYKINHSFTDINKFKTYSQHLTLDNLEY